MSDCLPSAEANFYVYAIKVDGQTRYIGKGRGDRSASHIRIARRVAAGDPPKVVQHVHRRLAKYLDRDIRIVRLHEGLEEREAFRREIAEIARSSGLWNLTLGGEGMSGYKLTPQAIEKLRQSLMRPEVRERLRTFKGKKHKPETIEIMRAAHRVRWKCPKLQQQMSGFGKGRRHSEETRAKIREARRHQVIPVEHMRRMRAIRGDSSPETRAKISAALKGHEVSAEARAKIGAAQRGRKHSAEHRAKNAAAQTGRRHSPETRAKMSAAAKAYRERQARERAALSMEASP